MTTSNSSRTRSTRITLPSRGNYDYLELPRHIQALINAVDELESVSAHLDTAERETRILDESTDPAERGAWRWYQEASLAAYKLHRTVREHAELAYVAWLMARAEEEAEEEAPTQPQVIQALKRTLAQEA